MDCIVQGVTRVRKDWVTFTFTFRNRKTSTWCWISVQWALVIIINIIILSHPLFSWQIYFFPLTLLQTGFLCFSSTWWRMVTLQLGTYTIQFMKPAENELASPSLSHKFTRGKIWLVQFRSGTLLRSNSRWLREAIMASTHGHRILVFWKRRGGSHNRSWGMEQTLNGLPQWSSGKESTCNAGATCSIPRSGRSPGKGNGNPLQYSWRIPWTEEPGRLQFIGSQNVGHDWSDLTHMLADTQ